MKVQKESRVSLHVAKKWHIALVVSLIICASGCVPSTRPNWWKFRANMANRALGIDGAQGKTFMAMGPPGLAEPGCPVLWSDQQHQTWRDSRVIVGGPGYVMTITTGNGQPIGTFARPGTYAMCASAQPDQHVIYVTDETLYKVQALNDNLTQLLWEFQLPAPQPEALPTSPTPYGDVVLVGSDTTLYALHDPRKGPNPVWKYNLGESVTSSSSSSSAPALTFAGDSAVISGRHGKVAKLIIDQPALTDQQRELWTTTVGNNTTVTESPAIGVGDAVFVPANDGVMYALNPETDADLAQSNKSRVRWKYDTQTNGHLTTPAVLYARGTDTVYFADNVGTLYAVDGGTGKLDWSVVLPAKPTTAPVVTPSGIVYIGVGLPPAGSVVAVDPKQQPSVIWQVTVGHMVRNLAVAENGAIWATTSQNLVRID
jgi:outer membrane protein assembly factor BamB